jgi:methylase of polypeptide subunit release factors
MSVSPYPIDYSEKYPENYPDEYIAGYVTFFGKKYSVSPHTLIPRLETESLVRRARQYIREQGVHTVVDIGTGSGILVLSLADMPTLQHIYALDISRDALYMAKQNGESMAKLAKQNGENETIYTRILYTQSDLLHTIDTQIVSNNLSNITCQTSPNIASSNILSHISENIPLDTISTPQHILIVTNLPYIRAEDWENMSADTVYEPRIALFGGVHT